MMKFRDWAVIAANIISMFYAMSTKRIDGTILLPFIVLSVFMLFEALSSNDDEKEKKNARGKKATKNE